MSAISRTVLREQVKDVLLQRIVSGELKPGERLVETRIASELGTSQAPVREALRDLELLRMVESEPFRGARVRAFGDDELIEVYPVRAVLEELAAKEAAKLLGGDVTVLEREVDEMRAASRRRASRSASAGSPRQVRSARTSTARKRKAWRGRRAAAAASSPLSMCTRACTRSPVSERASAITR